MQQDAYAIDFRRRMDSYHKGLWEHLEELPSLEATEARGVLSYLLELACRAQHMRNIELGRAALVAIPREWLLSQIEVAAEPLIQLNDQWECRRLIELYQLLDAALARRLAQRALGSQNPDIREAGEEFLLEE